MKKKLFIKTYGCQMNVYDSGKMADILTPLGYEAIDAPDNADMIILNTCHIREKATEKMYSDLGRYHQLKQDRQAQAQDIILAVAGCVAQAEGEEITRRAPYVDMVFGPQTYHCLPEMIAQLHRKQDAQGARLINLDFPLEPKFDVLPETEKISGASVFLTIQEGCDKFCRFCCVPYTRGAEFSRAVSEITQEARHLVQLGAKEITLLGQNVNAYHGQGPDNTEWNLGQLLRHLSEVEDLERLRYTTSHPRDVNADLIAAHRDLPKVMPFLHLPVQSGSDCILAAMNRRHTAQEYFDIIAQFQEACPQIAFSSDFIVGYPGESDADFEDTLTLVKNVKFAQAFSFKYSSRPGTPAAAMENQVPEHVKSERLQRLQEILQQQQLEFNQSCVGSKQKVLLEKEGRNAGQMIGRSPFLQSVHVEASSRLLGHTIEVMVTSAGQNSLSGEIVTYETQTHAA